MLRAFTAANAVAGVVSLHITVDRAQFRRIYIPYHSSDVPREAVSDLPPELSLGTLMAYEPVKEESEDLILFLPGSKEPCDYYSELLETAGSNLHTLCLPYDNRDAIGILCHDKEESCYHQLRLEALQGSFNDVHDNNIRSRLLSALRYLSKEGGPWWDRYVDKTTNLPRWELIRATGHSQGAGHAALMGYYYRLARVVQFSGTCDPSGWITKLGEPTTPRNLFFGMASKWDDMLCPTTMKQIPTWQAETHSIPSLLTINAGNVTVTSIGSSHFVISDLMLPGCDSVIAKIDPFHTCSMKLHDSTAANNWPGGSPYARGVWQALFGI